MQLQNFINGNFVAAGSGNTLPNHCPADGQIYGSLPDSDATDVDAAYQAARAAFPGWSQRSPEERSRTLLRISELIEANLEKLAAAESRDNGKPLALARSIDIPRAAANFRFFAQAATQFASESHETTGPRPAFNFTLRRPLGVVGCISPWNLPLYLFTWKIAPALATGNCVVAKPSEVTPATAHSLAGICREAGLPPGVLNIVHGRGATAGNAIVEHPGIKAISFTGGTATGAHIARTAAPLFKKLSLELGGKNPNLIFADCDFAKMLDTTVRSSFANQGQICLCGSRILVERSIYDRFRTAFLERVQQLRVGHPNEPTSDLGALVSAAHLEKVQSYIALTESEGGKLLCGGERARVPGFEQGYYLQPTVIEVPNNDCRLNQEEIFGPVVTLLPFDTEAEALELANGTKYGLSATVWTENLPRALRVSSALETGIVWVNTWMHRDLRTPFGGAKASGVGREGGWEAMRFFTEAKNVCLAM